jgi:hypothetical protein
LHIHKIPEYGSLPFHFNPLWLNHPEVISLVELTWKTWVPTHLVFIWEKKLIMVKQALKLWAKSSFNLPDKEKEELKLKLDNFQKDLEQRYHCPTTK